MADTSATLPCVIFRPILAEVVDSEDSLWPRCAECGTMARTAVFLLVENDGLSRERMILFQSNRVLVTLILVATSGGQLSADEVERSASAVEKLAADLSHQEFRVRESATRKLPQLGTSVIEPVTEVALQDNLEAGLRAVSILEELYQSSDAVAFDLAETSLKRLMTESKLPAVAQRAAQTLDDNQFTVTQRRAIAEVRRLGGQIQTERDLPVLVNGEQLRPENGGARAAAISRHGRGGDEGLKHLARLKSLQSIYLVGKHPLSEEAIEQLRNELPDTLFQTRGPAMLGVSTLPGPVGCLIGTVRADSSAEKAGMRPGDIVVEIAGKPVLQPEDLITLIGEQSEDADVEIIALRGDPILRYKLFDLTQSEHFSPVLAIGILSQMRTKFTVSLGEWSIDE